MKKFVCLMISLILLISLFSACSKTNTSTTDDGTIGQSDEAQEVEDNPIVESKPLDISPDEFTLPLAKNDSINPYTAQSKQNKLLSTLIYESLVTLDADFQPKYQLAALISVTQNEYTILLRNGAKFSDGTLVTADDVVYSFNTAKESDAYKGVFDNVKSIGAVSGDVVITLKEPDQFFANLLTFPVIPARSKDKKASNGRIDAPIGSGRYRYSYSSAEQTLVLNDYYNGGSVPSIKIIRLIDTPDNDSLRYYLNSGKLSLYYTDFSNNDYLRVNGNSVTVNLNNLLYIGINSKDKNLENKAVRRAVSFAINRSEICNKNFYNISVPANGLYHPAFTQINISDDDFYSRQIDTAVEELTKIGYNNNSDDAIMRKGDDELSLRLLVNEENPTRVQAAEQIAGYLREAGFRITLDKVPFDSYSHKIEILDYDLYLGEVKLNNNMDLSPLLVNEKVTAYGVSKAVGEQYQKFRMGDISAENFKKYFQDEMPVIPILYRQGLLSYSKSISESVQPAVSDIFYGIESWSYKTSD